MRWRGKITPKYVDPDLTDWEDHADDEANVDESGETDDDNGLA